MKTCSYLSMWLIWAATLSGCGGMLTSDQPPEHVYWLEATSLRLGEASMNGLPDLIVAVDTVPGLDTDRILVKEPGARLNYYAGARWPDHLPEVLTATVRLSLESSGRFGRVSSGTQIKGDEWLLELELREFFAVATATDAPPRVHVHLAGHANCGVAEAAVSATARTPAQENSLSRIVAAFQSATNEALNSLGRQLVSSCSLKEAKSD